MVIPIYNKNCIGKKDVVEILVRKRANLGQRSNNGETALQVAIRNGNKFEWNQIQIIH